MVALNFTVPQRLLEDVIAGLREAAADLRAGATQDAAECLERRAAGLEAAVKAEVLAVAKLVAPAQDALEQVSEDAEPGDDEPEAAEAATAERFYNPDMLGLAKARERGVSVDVYVLSDDERDELEHLLESDEHFRMLWDRGTEAIRAVLDHFEATGALPGDDEAISEWLALWVRNGTPFLHILTAVQRDCFDAYLAAEPQAQRMYELGLLRQEERLADMLDTGASQAVLDPAYQPSLFEALRRAQGQVFEAGLPGVATL